MTLSYLPTILVAIIFGLSSDYEVFVVSRIKEDFTKTGDARGAVERGTGVPVRVVSAAALIMFSSRASSHLAVQAGLVEGPLGQARASRTVMSQAAGRP